MNIQTAILAKLILICIDGRLCYLARWRLMEQRFKIFKIRKELQMNEERYYAVRLLWVHDQEGFDEYQEMAKPILPDTGCTLNGG